MNNEFQLYNSRVLIVDDEELNISLLGEVLTDEGYLNVISTTDSREAEELIRTEIPDVLLLDINMPHLDGFDIMEMIKKRFPGLDLPIMVLTSKLDRETRLKALELGANEFLNKPFDISEALLRIRNMVEKHLLHNMVKEQNQILEKKVRNRIRALRESRWDIVRRLGRAAEYRDNETGNHVLRVSRCCRIVGEEMGMNGREAELLQQASPMHDVGKIGIPDHILLKPGKLDREEWKIMKGHSGIGADILKDGKSPLVIMAHDIALMHHEKWNGKGYPRGLAQEDIPLVGRIVAICDVFDALLSDRPYKKPWPLDRTLEELKRSSGSHFDPAVVDAFMKNIDRMVEVEEGLRDHFAH